MGAMTVSDYTNFVYNGSTTVSTTNTWLPLGYYQGNLAIPVTPAAPVKKSPLPNLEWLDKRVDEMRVAL